jgi:hypothetical protein
MTRGLSDVLGGGGGVCGEWLRGHDNFDLFALTHGEKKKCHSAQQVWQMMMGLKITMELKYEIC